MNNNKNNNNHTNNTIQINRNNLLHKRYHYQDIHDTFTQKFQNNNLTDVQINRILNKMQHVDPDSIYILQELDNNNPIEIMYAILHDWSLTDQERRIIRQARIQKWSSCSPKNNNNNNINIDNHNQQQCYIPPSAVKTYVEKVLLDTFAKYTNDIDHKIQELRFLLSLLKTNPRTIDKSEIKAANKLQLKQEELGSKIRQHIKELDEYLAIIIQSRNKFYNQKQTEIQGLIDSISPTSTRQIANKVESSGLQLLREYKDQLMSSIKTVLQTTRQFIDPKVLALREATINKCIGYNYGRRSLWSQGQREECEIVESEIENQHKFNSVFN